ncbi:MAG: RimK/LysX family protein, partial [Luteimonas sp.]
DERVVRDSGGKRSTRVFLRTRLTLAGCAREIEINLTDRAGMRFPMLLGRTAIAGMFMVDPAVSFLHGRRRRPR